MFTVVNIQEDDLSLREDVELFLEAELQKSKNNGVKLRSEEQLRLAFRSGYPLCITVNTRVIGVSFVYEYHAGEHYFFEIGTMLVTEAYQGFGLQKFLAQQHMLQMLATDAFEGKNVAFAVAKRDSPSEHILRDNVGMQPNWAPPAAIAQERASQGLPFDPAKNNLLADEATIKKALTDLKGLHRGLSEFITPKQQNIVKVQLGWFSPELLDFEG